MRDKVTEQLQNQDVFSFCGKIDLYCLNGLKLDMSVAVAEEHAFRSVVVTQDCLDELVSLTDGTDISPIVLADYPNGNSSLDIRNYSIISAKEKGAKEIEITVPYKRLRDNKAFDDCKALVATADKHNIEVRYCLDVNRLQLTEQVLKGLEKVLSMNKMSSLSLEIKNDINHSENILNMRRIINKTKCKVKVYLDDSTAENVSDFVKAGAEWIGLGWSKAGNIAATYNDLVRRDVQKS